MHRSLFSVNRVAAILAMGSAILVAQGTQTANITGEIRDEAHQPVAAATVRLTSNSMQGTRTIVTDEKGRFNARLLPPGIYQIEAWKTGFQTAKITAKLGMEQNFQPTITMVKTVGAIVEVISTASAAVDKTDVKTASNYQLDAVDELPTANRTMETVAALSPGVTDNGVGGRLQIRGAMTSGNLFLLDGQNVADSTYGTRGVAIIEDSIEEVEVVTGAISAEYGSVDGGVVNSSTRSGSNSFDGQLRWELQNPAWDSVRSTSPQSSQANLLGQTTTTSFGGPILKDKLWFHFSYFRNKSTQTEFIDPNSDSLTDANKAYPFSQNEIRKQIKLTYAVNENHTVVASFMDNTNTQAPRDYSAAELNALEHQLTTSGFYSIAVRSIWSPLITSEVRYGQKREALYAGSIVNGDPIYEDAGPVTGDFYNAGIFNFNDGGDHRNNRTFNAKVSLFWDANGSHQTDVGFDFYRGLRRAANEQATNNRIFEVASIGNGGDSESPQKPVPAGMVNTPEAVWTFYSDTRQAESDTYGLYANDKWALNKNFSFQIGFRYDKYTAKDTSGNQTVSATGFSPRLGVNWDIMGDSVWLAKASFSRYNAGVADAIASQVTNAGNPTEIDYFWTGAASLIDANGNTSIANATNLSNYGNYNSATGQFDPATVAYYNNPSLNVKLDKNLKSPHTDEWQASVAYSFKTEMIGNGFVRLTAVNKIWKDLFDYRSGNDGTVTDPVGDVYYNKVWENSPVAERKYKDLELETQTTLNGWIFNYNITWSDLEGNYQGEGSATPFAGQGLSYFTNVNGVQMFDPSVNNAYGKLIGDTPLRMRGTLSKIIESSWGKTTVGLVYRFDSGQHFSYTRSIGSGLLNPAFASGGSIPYGATTIQYLNDTRGAGIYPATSYLDLALTQDFKLATFGKTPVNAFLKVNMQNFLNHTQIAVFNSTYASAPKLSAGGSLNSPWVPGGLFGQATGYGTGRIILLSAGVRF